MVCNERLHAFARRAQTPAMLKGIIFGADGRAMTPTHARKGGRLYRYYVAARLLEGDVPPAVVRHLPAGEIEAAVVDQLRGLLRSPEIIVGTWRSARPEIEGLSETEVREALQSLDPVWDQEIAAAEKINDLRAVGTRSTCQFGRKSAAAIRSQPDADSRRPAPHFRRINHEKR